MAGSYYLTPAFDMLLRMQEINIQRRIIAGDLTYRITALPGGKKALHLMQTPGGKFDFGNSELMKGKIYVWDKNLVFFPKKIQGKLAVLHRLHPSIQLLCFTDPNELTRSFWEEYISNLGKHIVLLPKLKHESSHIGAGCPPIETEKELAARTQKPTIQSSAF